MYKKRKTTRLKGVNEITVTILSGGENPPKEKFFYNQSKDISVYGARIKTYLFLPVDTLLSIEMTLKTLNQMITVLGKVKWTKVIFGDESFETGVEFFNPPSDAIKRLKDYISLKQKSSMPYPV